MGRAARDTDDTNEDWGLGPGPRQRTPDEVLDVFDAYVAGARLRDPAAARHVEEAVRAVRDALKLPPR